MNRFKGNQGAASLEMLIVLIPWLAIIFIFLNVVFMLGSLMVNQSIVNRGAQQIAAVGCLPASLERDLESGDGIGVTEATVRAIAPRTVNRKPILSWDRSRYLNSDGKIRNDVSSQAIPVAACPTDGSPLPSVQIIPSGNFVFVQISYRQSLPLLDLASTVSGSIPGSVEVQRNALVVSQSLEGEG